MATISQCSMDKDVALQHFSFFYIVHCDKNVTYSRQPFAKWLGLKMYLVINDISSFFAMHVHYFTNLQGK